MNLRAWWLEAFFGIAAFGAVMRYGRAIEPGDMRSIAELYVAVASTMLGFMVAALAILTAVVDRRLVINLRKTGHYQRLLREIYCACVGFLCTLVMALLCLFIPGGLLHASIAIATSALAAALVLLVSSGRKFARVMEYLAE